jgi:hypothetical protein
MTWEEIHFNRILTDDELATAIGQVFNIAKDRVNVRREDQGERESSSCYLDVAVYSVPGEYPTLAFIILLHLSLVPVDTLQTVGRLCESLSCHALIGYAVEYKEDAPYSEHNPYISTLIRGKGDYSIVAVDPSILDETNGILITRYI